MKLIKIYIAVICVISCLLSCDDMNDLHIGYLERGESIYAAKVDSVSPGPGNNRIEMEVFIYTQRIDHLRFFWNARSDSADFNIGNHAGAFKFMIENLPEREYLFEIVSYDKFGNKSLPFEVSSLSYGESYQRYLSNRGIASISKTDGNAVISWLDLPEDAVYTTMYYKNSANNDVNRRIDPSEEETVIVDYKPASQFRYITSYRPKVNSPDTFETEETTDVFPN